MGLDCYIASESKEPSIARIYVKLFLAMLVTNKLCKHQCFPCIKFFLHRQMFSFYERSLTFFLNTYSRHFIEKRREFFIKHLVFFYIGTRHFNHVLKSLQLDNVFVSYIEG